MTTETAAQIVPSFPARPRLLPLLRDLGIIALCAAIVAGFLIEVWSAPQPGTRDAQRTAAVHHRV